MKAGATADSTYDPCASYVLMCLRQGMTPSEIDSRRHWWPGTAAKIIAEAWSQEEE